MMDRNVLWKRTGIVVAAVVRMCLNAQGEDSYETRNSVLMKFTPTVTGGEEISSNVAACELSLRGLSRVRDLWSESYVQVFVPGKLKTAVFRSLRGIFPILVNVIKGFCHLQWYFQACI